GGADSAGVRGGRAEARARRGCRRAGRRDRRRVPGRGRGRRGTGDRGPARQHQGHERARPAAGGGAPPSPPRMLTDLHVHLRPDDLDRTAADHFTAENAEHYLATAHERGVEYLGVSEHVYRFRRGLSIWDHPFWRENAQDDLDEYCAFIREDTGLRLGIEVDFVP